MLLRMHFLPVTSRWSKEDGLASSHTSFELWIEDTDFYHDTLLTVQVFPELTFLPPSSFRLSTCMP
jgi:hypothetical protein